MPIETVQTDFRNKADESIEWLKNELTKVRTGRASAALVENVVVEHYGARTPLNGLASISNSDARTIVIQPWDESAVPAIEKAIVEASLGVQPTVDGRLIRLAFPMLTEEMREQSVKLMHKKAEETRVRLRKAREDGLGLLHREQKDGSITEDDFFAGRKKLDDLIGEANEKIANLVKNKEEEVMSI
jgi:ribosome recycling factor